MRGSGAVPARGTNGTTEHSSGMLIRWRVLAQDRAHNDIQASPHRVTTSYRTHFRATAPPWQVGSRRGSDRDLTDGEDDDRAAQGEDSPRPSGSGASRHPRGRQAAPPNRGDSKTVKCQARRKAQLHRYCCRALRTPQAGLPVCTTAHARASAPGVRPWQVAECKNQVTGRAREYAVRYRICARQENMCGEVLLHLG